MTNQQISKILEEIADVLEIQGENVFKVRAYRRAAEARRWLLQTSSDASAAS